MQRTHDHFNGTSNNTGTGFSTAVLPANLTPRCGCGSFQNAAFTILDPRHPIANAIPSDFKHSSGPMNGERAKDDEFRGVFTDWGEDWNDVQIEREEQRRLCWTSLTLFTTLQEQMAWMGQRPVELYLARQENVRPSTYASFLSSSNFITYIWLSRPSLLTVRALLSRRISVSNRYHPPAQTKGVLLGSSLSFRYARFDGRAFAISAGLPSAESRHCGSSVVRGCRYRASVGLAYLPAGWWSVVHGETAAYKVRP